MANSNGTRVDIRFSAGSLPAAMKQDRRGRLILFRGGPSVQIHFPFKQPGKASSPYTVKWCSVPSINTFTKSSPEVP